MEDQGVAEGVIPDGHAHATGVIGGGLEVGDELKAPLALVKPGLMAGLAVLLLMVLPVPLLATDLCCRCCRTDCSSPSC